MTRALLHSCLRVLGSLGTLAVPRVGAWALVIGAIVGGWVFSLFGSAGVTGLNLYSLVVAVVGAVIVLLVYHAFRRSV